MFSWCRQKSWIPVLRKRSKIFLVCLQDNQESQIEGETVITQQDVSMITQKHTIENEEPLEPAPDIEIPPPMPVQDHTIALGATEITEKFVSIYFSYCLEILYANFSDNGICRQCGFRSWPSCSKLTMSLVNVSLKLWSLNMAYMLIFLLKKCE